MKRFLPWLLALSGFLFATGFGLWSQTLFTQSESVHFSVNFPSEEGESGAKTMACCDLGGPWARIPVQDWTGYPAGGVLVWGTEGCIVLDVGREGMLKRALQPGLITSPRTGCEMSAYSHTRSAWTWICVDLSWIGRRMKQVGTR